jgi:tagatose 1,6-diphosphate aldolase
VSGPERGAADAPLLAHLAGEVNVHIGDAARSDRLDRLATPSGQFAILALDHVRSFATTVRPDDPDSLSADDIVESKEGLIRGLGVGASAILIDPALATRRSDSAWGSSVAGVLVGVEDGDYESAVASPRFLPGWTVDRAARLGADGIKVSVYFDADADTSGAVGFVREVSRQCRLVDLPLFCEPLVPRGDGLDTRRRVIDGIRVFGDLGVDVLKIQFPCDTAEDDSRASWADACAEASEISPTPWALLSEGRDFGEFRELLAIACRAGASGFVAGRVIWGAISGDGRGLEAASARLSDLREIAVSEGQPWRGPAQPGTGGGDAP